MYGSTKVLVRKYESTLFRTKVLYFVLYFVRKYESTKVLPQKDRPASQLASQAHRHYTYTYTYFRKSCPRLKHGNTSRSTRAYVVHYLQQLASCTSGSILSSKVLSYFRTFESTKIDTVEYFQSTRSPTRTTTFVLSYESTFESTFEVLSYFRTFVHVLSYEICTVCEFKLKRKIVRKYFRTFVRAYAPSLRRQI